jgi:hypothetical protein
VTTLNATTVIATTANVTTANITTGNVTNMTSGNVTITGGSINGTTLGATTASTANVTTLTTSSTVTINGGTANGVAYLNGSKVLTTGSALTFDGTNISTALGGSYYSANANYGFGTPDSAGLQIFAASGDSIRFGSRSAGTFSEQMRLNSTGLGIGTSSPGAKLDVAGNIFATGFGRFGGSLGFIGKASDLVSGGSASDTALRYDGNNLVFSYSSTERMRIDSSGNLGLGVTPSAWISSYRALNIGDSGLITSRTGVSINNLELGVNWFRNTSAAFVYKANGFGTNYQQVDGVHAWYTAPSGTAGDTISFTQAMTLDANGSLAVGGTTVVTNNGGITATTTVSGSVAATLAMRNAGTGNGSGTTLVFRGVSNASAEHDYAYVAGVADDTTAKTGSIRFSTTAGSSPVERARIDSSGNLLIGGTTTPSGGKANNFVNLGGSGGFWTKSGGVGYFGTFDNYAMVFATNDTERARITSAGFLGIGTSTPATQLSVTDTITIGTADKAIQWLSGGSALADIRADSSSNLIFRNGSGYTERARITSGGDLYVGNTTTSTPGEGNTTGGVSIQGSGKAYFSVATARALTLNRNEDGAVAGFFRSGTQVGSISVTTTATAYNTSSDYRLKDNQQLLTGSGAFIDSLKPKTWAWKSDGSKGVGFIAHEVQEVSPGSVVGEKDAVDAEGNPVYQAMEYGSAEFIANIIAELQSLRARVAALESQA